jgi:hypothetical protein
MVKENSRKERKKNGEGHYTSSIIDGQAKPVCSFCGNIGHVENNCRVKERAMKDATQFTKEKDWNGRRTSLKKLNPLQLQQQKQHLPVPPKRMILMRTNLISIIS